jgi:hypothetical protein
MSFGELFVARARRPLEKGTSVSASRAKGEPVGLFITPKSLMAFPTASSVVTMLALLSRGVLPTWVGSNSLIIGSSLFVGTIIFAATISQPELKPRSWGQWFVAVGVAVVNSAYLSAAGLGILGQIPHR